MDKTFVSTMPMERRKEIGKKAAAAIRAGDMNLAISLAKQVPLPLSTAELLKADWGIERLKEAGFNLDDAVAAYGQEWLNA